MNGLGALCLWAGLSTGACIAFFRIHFLRDRAVAAHQPHKLEVAGSIPAPVTTLTFRQSLYAQRVGREFRQALESDRDGGLPVNPAHSHTNAGGCGDESGPGVLTATDLAGSPQALCHPPHCPRCDGVLTTYDWEQNMCSQCCYELC
jgi:hypothetical protein